VAASPVGSGHPRSPGGPALRGRRDANYRSPRGQLLLSTDDGTCDDATSLGSTIDHRLTGPSCQQVVSNDSIRRHAPHHCALLWSPHEQG
jgi:hypothetical protein